MWLPVVTLGPFINDFCTNGCSEVDATYTRQGGSVILLVFVDLTSLATSFSGTPGS